MKQTFYEMLGVPHDANQSQIDDAYSQTTIRLNATTNVRGASASVAEMRLLAEGYQLLSNPEQRARYDAKLSAEAAGIKLMFYPKDNKSRRKLSIDTVVFAALATALTGIIYFQLTKKMDEERVNYQQGLDKKREEQNKPVVIDATQPETPVNEKTDK
jgi:curved DNA-binding protein CbpA